MEEGDFDTKEIKKITMDRFGQLQRIWPKPITWRERLTIEGVKWYVRKFIRLCLGR